MSLIAGKKINISLFGESHGKLVGLCASGIREGIKIDEDYIRNFLKRRSPVTYEMSTKRKEDDDFEIVSGVFKNYTTGMPLSILIKNKDVKSQYYEEIKDLPRPSHADYVSRIKYEAFNDYRGGGSFSARLTAPMCALGAIFIRELEKKNVRIYTSLMRCGDIEDEYKDDEEDLKMLQKNVYHSHKEEEISEYLKEIRKDKDSVGAKVRLCVKNLPIGLGEPLSDKLDANIAKILFSIPALKGVSFGRGFEFASLRASKANDCYIIDKDKIRHSSNNQGGVSGGLSNGEDLIIDTVFKPIPSIAASQRTVDMSAFKESEITIAGRHDVCVIPRVYAVLEAYTAIALYDFMEG